MNTTPRAAGIVGPVAFAIAGALAAIVPSASQACGACVEDKIAATYDHRVIERASASGSVMVFCAITGPFDAQRLKEAVRRVRGVQPQSVRVSAQLAAVSFAVDPRVRAPHAVVEAAQRHLASGTRVSIVRLQGPSDWN